VLGIADAAHEEANAGSPRLVVSRLACSLVGERQTVRIMPGTVTHQAYRRAAVEEQFRCRYGLNPAFRERIVAGGLCVAGVGPGGEARIVELSAHPFYVGTLFLPQLTSETEAPHPLIVAYLRAALDARAWPQRQ
jgi:CTP synthase (UTP-ammonia lyase)